MKTITHKGAYGWAVDTWTDTTCITTMKRYGGHIASSISKIERETEGVLIMSPSQSVYINHGKFPRVTKELMEKLHSEAVKSVLSAVA